MDTGGEMAKRYRFYLYRDTFSPGGDSEKPETRDVATGDAESYARGLCKGAVHKVEWDVLEPGDDA